MSALATPSRPPVDEPAAEPVIDVTSLGVSVGDLTLVEDVSFTIGRGERVGLIGESGSGKSLTGLALLGLLPDDLRASGSVCLSAAGGLDITTATERELTRVRGRDVAMVFQEPMTALNPTMKVGDQVAEALLVHQTVTDRRAAARRVVELLTDVRLRDPADVARAYPHQLSGGQRQRVVLAIALANDPALLVCDEPTTALDVTVQALVLDLVVRGVEARDAALLLITHDLAVVATTCERVLVMYGGRIVEAGPVDQVFTRPRHRYTAGLVAASDLTRVDGRGRLSTIPGTVPPAGGFPDGCVFRTRCAHASDECAVAPRWTGTDDGHGYACHHPAGGYRDDPPRAASDDVVALATETSDAKGASAAASDGVVAGATETSDARGAGAVASDGAVAGATETSDARGGDAGGVAAAISVRDVTRQFVRARRSLTGPKPVIPALRGVSFEVQPGERFGIVGESGCGKSTLLRILGGLDQPTSGAVVIEGTEIGSLPERRLRFLRERLQLMFQDPMGSLDPRMRVRDIVAEPLVAQRHPAPRERVPQLLTEVGLQPEAAHRYPHQFSGGQRQRISIARALAPRPGILLADEPVSALDVSVRAQVLNLISDLVEELDLTLVLVSHDLSVVRHLCDRVAVMSAGEIVEIGPTRQIWESPQHPYTQRLLAAVPTIAGGLGAGHARG